MTIYYDINNFHCKKYRYKGICSKGKPVIFKDQNRIIKKIITLLLVLV